MQVNLCGIKTVTVEIPKEFAFCLTETQQIVWLYNELLELSENGGGGGGTFDVTIGDNGNWYINGKDTGKPSRGPEGPQGPAGPTGPEGPAGPQGNPGTVGPEGPTGADGAAGADGFSPTVTTAPIENGTRVTITDATGVHTFDVLNGKNGGEAATPTIGEDGNWYIGGVDTGKPSRGPEGPRGEQGPAGAPGETGPQGDLGPAGPEGPKGPAGADGAKGDTGPAGPEGPTGPEGPAGPTGPEGPKGPAGADGATGPAGADGFSPTVTTTPIENGTRVTITDASGEHTFDVLNGTGGGGGTTETFTVPESALYYLFATSTFPFGMSETYSNITAWHYMSSSANTPVSVTLDPTTGAVTLDAEMLVDMGNTSNQKPATFGGKYNSEDGTWWGSLRSFGVFNAQNVSDENTKRLNGMKIEGISVYKDGKHRAEFSYVTEKVMEYPAPTVPQVDVKLAVNGLYDSATVVLGDTLRVKIRGHIAPTL